MTGSLSKEQVDHFRKHGFAYPFDAISAEEAAECVRRLDSYDAPLGGEAQKQLKIKAHVAAPWIVDLARNPKILDAVESVIGPDILLFGASVFSKKAHDERFVSWHQDAAYYGLDPQEEVTCWLGLTDADMENGCMRVMPGSHLAADADHEETYDPKNLLGRGQTIHGVDDDKSVYMPVSVGQFSIHHERTWHGSRFSICPPMRNRLSAAARRPLSGVKTDTITGMPNRCRKRISIRSAWISCARAGRSIPTPMSRRPPSSNQASLWR